MQLVPAVAKFMRIRFIAKEIGEKLIDFVSQSLKHREENKIIRLDFLHFTAELKKTCKSYEFTDNDVSAHLAGFFGDGYETSSIVMSFMLYEIAANHQIQTKLRKEIKEAYESNSNKMSYEALQGLSYLDSVVNEAMRINPPVFSLLRFCTKQFTLLNSTDKTVTPLIIEQGTPIALPIYGLQYDPKYFENPEIFNPERFLKTNRKYIKYSYFPFGEGPRTCLGQKFGILQIKVGIVHIIKKYELFVNKKTSIPIVYDPSYFLATPIGGIWLDFKKII